ncbi:uncharacterized protein PGTG_03101 [Puccinia graminis f. sp. tritici CRL 75-36-700-3]|uniref:Uncharacterized protein n=1 Tax=Puccinia graminis f. sp. tritici (strain CRL 75-36-700-3 / race SCCL) TaxID=418459 RepID=E3JYM0_PUCGT|nr:uncharacterized protein PGTG_03101 [Puccinia graminis f. sp. tritici CRL 75-36-700-3]EFP77145.1 hypothetical protein PGTG_03101 [Puccinia graminis f. sp. tritici CRL 75-36-700-3]
MLAHGFVFVSVISLLVRSSLAIDCYPGTVVDSKECHRALSQIVYEKGDVLGTDSKHFGYIYGNCSIIVVNPKGASPSKRQIESGFNQILGKCKPESGGGNLPANEAVFLNIGNRGTGPYAPYESDFPFLKEACGLNTNAPDTKKEDCLKAYNSIPLSAEGQFLSDNHTETIKILKTYQTCTVHIYASDGSNIVATNGNVRPVFKKMLNQCNGKSGVVSMKKGVQGHNGRLFLKTRSSVPCGIDGENKQVCH